MRDPQIVEEELAEIAAIQDDLLKFERIVAWSAMHPDEAVFAVRFLRNSKGLESWVQQHTEPESAQPE